MLTSDAIILASPNAELQKLHLGIHRQAVADTLYCQPAPPPPEVLGDLLALLIDPHVRVDTSEKPRRQDYRFALFEISQGRRWRILQRRHGIRERPRPRQQAAHAAGSERHRLDDAEARWSNALRFVLAEFGRRIAPLQTSNASDQIEVIGGHLADLIKPKSGKLVDPSTVLVDDAVLFNGELARLGYTYELTDALLMPGLIDVCLAARWDNDEYTVRRLDIINLPGIEIEREPGDLSGIRGVTIKTRDEQIRDVLPSEFAAIAAGEEGKRLAMDKIMNRGALILEHFEPTRPLSRHRVLVALIAGAAPPEAGRSHAPHFSAHVRARAAVFELLFGLVRSVPRKEVRVDIALFVRNANSWNGAFFPLDLIEPHDQAWRNALEMSSIIRGFFERYEALSPKDTGLRAERVASEPAPWLARKLTSGLYRCGFLAAFGRDEERGDFLPAPSLPLRRFDTETPQVIYGAFDENPTSVEWLDVSIGEAAALSPLARICRQARTARASAFTDLLAAHSAPSALEETSFTELADQFLTMVVGPRRTV